METVPTGINDSESEGEDQQIPDYIFPIFFTTKTQELFDCKGDEDVTEENPHILIRKERILEDFKERAAISDFHPAKKIVQKYPGDEILVVYDPLLKYGHNFYMVTTEEGKELVLNGPPQEEVVEDDEVGSDSRVTPESTKQQVVCRPWESLGSEKDIEEENVHETRTKVKFSISKLRKDFGAPVEFSDRDVSDVKDGLIEYLSYQDDKFEIFCQELDKGIQNVPELVENFSQTNWPYPKNANTQYVPRLLEEEERQVVAASEEVAKFMNGILLRLEMSLQYNETLDIFINDYLDLGDEESTFGSKSDNHLREYQSFTDLQFSKNKIITAIQWHPTICGLIAVSCAQNISFDDRADVSSKILMSPSLVLIWSFADPIHPLLLLESPDDIMCFQFNPSDPNLVVGGCINGQIVLWDISKYSERLKNHRSQAQTGHSKTSARNTLPIFFYWDKQERSPIVRWCAVSNIEQSHRMAITDVCWMPDHIEIGRMGAIVENKKRYCHQLASCSPDGHILFWDCRSHKSASVHDARRASEHQPSTFGHLDLTWKPALKVTLTKLKGSDLLHPVKFSFFERQGDRPSGEMDKKTTEPSQRIQDSTSLHSNFKRKEDNKNVETAKTKFYSATEDGDLVYMDWTLIKDSESGKIVCQKPEFKLEAHDGPAVSLERSPFYQDIILSVGGWTFAIWKEEVTTGPLLISHPHTVKLMCGMWSPTRPGVFFIGRQDGNVDVWDLLDKTHEPFLVQNVTPSSVLAVYPFQVSKKQQLLAVGDGLGTLHIMEISWNLRLPSPNEVSVIQNYFDRETKRLEYRTQQDIKRAREAKEMETEEKAPVKDIKDRLRTPLNEIEDSLKEEYKEFLALEKRILVDLGIRSHDNGH